MRNYEQTWRSQNARVGELTCMTLGFPAEWTIKKVVVTQVGGPTVTGRVRVFNSARACPVNAGSLSYGGDDPDADYTADPSAYEVMPPMDIQSTANGGSEAQLLSDVGYEYLNRDGKYLFTSPVDRVYVQIELPTQAGAADGVDTTWDVTLGGWSDVR